MMNHTLEDHAAASVVAMLGSKRGRDELSDNADMAGGVDLDFLLPAKIARVDTSPPEAPAIAPAPATSIAPEARTNQLGAELFPAPYFYYKDYSEVSDPDPLAPLTPPGKVPNFPAKMHAILSRTDLADIVAWMPHGRSWRVLKPREFEVKVIPIYFEHSKFSSFIRQANGWGFRRITQGRDRNSYYHPLFLRGLPHLCKQMKRPGVSEKVAVDVDHEPDFYKISEISPVPEKADDDSIMLHCTVNGGPKARMPVYGGSVLSTGADSTAMSTNLQGQAFLASFQQALAAANGTNGQQMNADANALLIQLAVSQLAAQAPSPSALPFGVPQQEDATSSAQAAAAASQFAAGFAAATALSQQNQFQSIWGQALAPQFTFQQQVQNQPNEQA